MNLPEASPVHPRVGSPFGRVLRQWRRRRGKSQLDLALEGGISARHLSFIETGRSRPKREFILNLASTLGIPLRETNDLLLAAGLPATYAEQDYDHTELEVYRNAVREMVANHSPYPAFVLNRWGDVIDANATAYRLVPKPADGTTLNLYEASLLSSHWPTLVENWPEVAWSAYWHLEKDADRYWGDERMQQLTERVYYVVRDLPQPPHSGAAPSVRTRLRMGNQVLESTTMVAYFEPTHDVFLSELRVEMLFPTNQTTRQFFKQLAS